MQRIYNESLCLSLRPQSKTLVKDLIYVRYKLTIKFGLRQKSKTQLTTYTKV